MDTGVVVLKVNGREVGKMGRTDEQVGDTQCKRHYLSFKMRLYNPLCLSVPPSLRPAMTLS